MSRTYRLAVLNSHPIQYFAPLYRRLAQEPEIDLTVYYCSRAGVDEVKDPGFGRTIQWDTPLLEGYRHKFLANWRRQDDVNGFTSLFNPKIVREITRGRYDALWLHGYSYATCWLALAAARLSRTPIFYRSESTLLPNGARRAPLAIKALKPLALRCWFSQVGSFLSIGTENKNFYLQQGIADARIFSTPYTVDNGFFQNQASRLSPARGDIRARFGIVDDRPIILFAGKLVPWKQPLLLLEAFRRVRETVTCALLFVGDGPLRESLEAGIRKHNIPDVTITGFLNQTQMPEAYTAADLLVLPSSYEPWGLVVNEAMNFGLPVVASDRVGCAPDLVRPGENGYTFAHDSVESLEHTLKRALTANKQLHTSRGNSRKIVQQWGLSQTVLGVVEALHALNTQ